MAGRPGIGIGEDGVSADSADLLVESLIHIFKDLLLKILGACGSVAMEFTKGIQDDEVVGIRKTFRSD